MLTAELLVAVMPKCPKDKLDEFAHNMSKAMLMAYINTVTRVAAFMGQIALESGELRWWKEFATKTDPHFTRYETGKLKERLGNTEPGDGEKYCGHGPMQVTGRANHQACSDWIKAMPEFGHVDLIATPELLSTDSTIGFLGAVWYWDSRKLNDLADKATLAGFKEITKAINGGYTHHAEREAYYITALQVLGKDARLT
jgi:putative chitinase